MNVEQVLTLLNAGYTREEINAMQERTTKPTPAQVPAPAPTPEPAPAPAPADTATAPGTQYSEILSAISALTSAIQANGIASSNQPTPASNESILASIIRPNL